MAGEKRITISRTLNGDTIYYIARNSSGIIFARALTLEKLEAVIKTYKEPPPLKEPAEAASAESSGEPKKKFLINELAQAVQKRIREPKKPQPQKPVVAKNKQLIKNELKTAVQARRETASVVRGAGGKFISSKTVGQDETKKKGFWNKLI